MFSCKSSSSPESEASSTEEVTPDFKISLAQWSLHNSFQKGEQNPADFPTIAAGYGVNSIELVNTFYLDKAMDTAYWSAFMQKCDDAGISVGLIMCDRLGDLGHSDEEMRMQTVQNHYPWVDLAASMGAHSIRVNAAGEGSREEVAANAVDGLKKLGTYGAEKGINIIVENHGGYSSDGSWLSGVMEAVGMDNVGTLPDFGNFCIESTPDGCANEYDRYKGMQEIMPYAKGVSAKSHDFDEEGNEVHTDYLKMMKIVKDSGFTGYIGIEYEGEELSEDEGIKATKALLEKVFKQL